MRRRGFAQDIAAARFDDAWASFVLGDGKRGIAEMEHALEAHRATGAQRGLPAAMGDLGAVLGRAGEVARGLALIEDALACIERTGEVWCAAELQRRRGELLLDAGRSRRAEAAAAIRQALEVARGQGAHLFALRAALTLARLHAADGADEEARGLLRETMARVADARGVAEFQTGHELLLSLGG